MDLIQLSWNKNLSSTEYYQLFTKRDDQLLIINKLFELIGQFSGGEKFSLEDIFFQEHKETRSSILYEYSFISLFESPHLFVNSILNSQQKDEDLLNTNLNKLGLVRFISEFGDKLFYSYNNPDLKINNKRYSYCCLLVLQICLSFGYDQYSLIYSKFTTNDKNYLNSYEFYISEISISKLSSSFWFILMISYSRLYYKKEILITKEMFLKR